VKFFQLRELLRPPAYPVARPAAARARSGEAGADAQKNVNQRGNLPSPPLQIRCWDSLLPSDLAELAAFVRQREEAVWDRQLDAEFAGDGRLRAVLEEVHSDVRAGRLEELP